MYSLTQSITIRKHPVIRDTVVGVLGSLFLALCAQISIPLGFTPVPITLQVFAVLMLGFFLTPMPAMTAVICYLLEGALGAPVFAGGQAGLAVCAGATAGYLIGFVCAAGFVSALVRRLHQPVFAERCMVAVLGVVLIHGCGACWLAHVVGFGLIWKLGIAPFIIGDVIQISAVAAIAGMRKD